MGGFVRSITGAKAAKKATRRGAGTARGDIGGAYDIATDQMQRAYDASSGMLPGYEQRAGDLLQQYATGAEGGITPFFERGQGAAQLEAALTGALGADAQAQAMAQFQESPAQAYLREMGEKAAMRGAASQGMSLSGNILAELQRRGAGLASQDFNTRIGQLSSIAQRGQTAGQNLANIRMGVGQNLAQGQRSLGSSLANMRSQLGGNLANLATWRGSALGNIATGSANQQAQIAQKAGADLMGLAGMGLGAGLGFAGGGAMGAANFLAGQA